MSEPNDLMTTVNLTTTAYTPNNDYFEPDPPFDIVFPKSKQPNFTVDDIRSWLNPANYPSSYRSERAARHTMIISFYASIVLVSLFGNLLVLHVILKRKRMRTSTNLLMANLVVSDLLMTIINIPFNIVRVLLNEWPFGSALCILVPLVQVTSVYVSTFTMTIIAIDRYQAIIRPLKKRLSTNVPTSITILIIWIASAIFAIPNVAFNRVVQVHKHLPRCRAVYPNTNELEYRRQVTLFTFLTQYCIPLSITAFAYVRISFYVWHKLTIPTERCNSVPTLASTDKTQCGAAGDYVEQSIPSVTNGRIESLNRPCYYQASVSQLRERSRRKTIKMLAIVVGVFTICWLPLNIYHLVDLFTARIINPNVFFACHWFAMSSVCWNSFIYFWLNRHYRQEIGKLAKHAKMSCFQAEELKHNQSLKMAFNQRPNVYYHQPHNHHYHHRRRKESSNDRIVKEIENDNNVKTSSKAKAKIVFKRYQNCSSSNPNAPSSSNSEHSSSSQRNRSKLYRSNAVRMQQQQQQQQTQLNDLSPNRANLYNSVSSHPSYSLSGNEI